MYNRDSIKTLRESLKLSSTAFCNATGISRQHLDALESGKSAPTAETIDKMLRAFKISADYFFVHNDTRAY